MDSSTGMSYLKNQIQHKTRYDIENQSIYLSIYLFINLSIHENIKRRL